MDAVVEGDAVREAVRLPVAVGVTVLLAVVDALGVMVLLADKREAEGVKEAVRLPEAVVVAD